MHFKNTNTFVVKLVVLQYSTRYEVQCDGLSDFQLILQTNIPFLLNVMQNEKFLKGQVDTYFIDDHPDL